MSEYNKSINGKLYNYFTQKLSLKNSTNGFLRGNCPYCGGKFTFGINIERGKVVCFKKCGIPNKPLYLLMHFEEFETLNEARQFLKVQQEFEVYEGSVKAPKYEIKPVELPESYTLITMGEGIMAKAARHYVKTRRFNLITCSMQGIGYCTDGEYAGYIIFPFYSKGKLIFFQGRRFAGNGPKMKNPAEEDFGIGKSQLIYNRDALFIYKRIYIVESITNSLTLGERAIALLGKSSSTYQLSNLISAPFDEAIIILDPDASKEAYKLGMQLVHYKKVKVVTWQGDKDVNDIGKKETITKVKETDFKKYMQLYKEHANCLNSY